MDLDQLKTHIKDLAVDLTFGTAELVLDFFDAYLFEIHLICDNGYD
jgi:hypothetical protein